MELNLPTVRGLRKKIKKGKKRTEVYYCHPYCSAERGSNENQNRMIRRHIPKGTNFDRKTKKKKEGGVVILFGGVSGGERYKIKKGGWKKKKKMKN